MNRRSFLSGLLKGAIAAAAAPQIITHGLGLKIPTYREIAMINPEYVNAPFEMRFIWDKNAMQMINGILVPKDSEVDFPGMIRDPYPMRFSTEDAQNPIPPFILQRRPR